MEETLVHTIVATPLPQLMIGALIRFGILFVAVWCVLQWPKDEFPIVLLGVGLTTLAGVLVETLLLPRLGLPVLAGTFIRAAVEAAVLMYMLYFRKMGMNAAFSLLPTYIVVIGLAELFLFD